MDTNTQYSNTSSVPLQSHSTNSFHKSSQQEQPVDQSADESFAPEEKFNVVEPSKLLEQTLTTDDLPRRGSRSSVQSNMELQRRSRSTDHSTALVPASMPSDALVVANQQPESPPDIKPELLDLEPPMSPVAGPSHSTDENSMMMYMDQSSMSGMPGPSGYQDNSALVSTDSQPQDVIIQPCAKKRKTSKIEEIQLQKSKENEKRLNNELKELKEKLELNEKKLCWLKTTHKDVMEQLNHHIETWKNMKCVEVQTDPILWPSSSEENSPPDSSGDEQSSPFIEHSSSNESDEQETYTETVRSPNESDEQETYTETVRQTKTVIRTERVTSIVEESFNNSSQTYEENRFMPGFLPFLPNNVATPVSPFLPFMLPTQGPIVLNSVNSASFAAPMQENNSNNY